MTESTSGTKEKGSFWVQPLFATTPGLTYRVLLVGIVYGLLADILSSGIFVKTSTDLQIALPLVVFLAFEAIVGKFWKSFGLTPQEWLIFGILGMNVFTTMWTGSQYVYGAILAFTSSSVNAAQYVQYLPSWFAPISPSDKTLISNYLYGGPVPWAALLPTIIIVILWILSTTFATTFLLLPLRKMWIEVERLPYPMSVVPMELIKRAKGQDRPSLWRIAEAKWFWIGLAIGVFTIVPQILNLVFGTAFAALTGFTFNLSPYVGTLLPGAVLDGYTWTALWFIPIAFMPLDVLGTSLLVWLIFYVLWPPLAISLGWGGGWGGQEGGWGAGIMVGARWHFAFEHEIILGGVPIGIALWILIAYYRRYRETINAAIRGAPREEGEALSWRSSWLGFIACSLVALAIFIISGAYLLPALVTYFIVILVGIWGVRLMGEAGIWLGAYGLNFTTRGIGAALGFWPADKLPTATADIQNEAVAIGLGQSSYYTQNYVTAPWFTMVDFKIGDATGTHPRSILAAVMIFGLLSTVIMAFVFTAQLYSVGWSYAQAHGISWFFGTHSIYFNNFGFMNGPDSALWYIGSGGLTGSLTEWSANPWIWVAFGVVLTFVLNFLRLMYPWFWLSPVGFVCGAWIAGWGMELGSFVLAFVLKTLTIKFGGAKAYDNMYIPGIVGFGAGVALTSGIWGLIQAISLGVL